MHKKHGGMRVPGLVLAAALALPASAMAQGTLNVGSETVGGAGGSATLGGLMASLINNIWGPFWGLLVTAAFVLGLWLIGTGLAKLRDVGSPHSSEALNASLRIFGGALLVALPDTIGMGLGTFYNTVTGHGLDGSDGPGAVTSCLAADVPFTCMAKNMADNLVPVFVEVAFALLFLIGAGMIAHAVYTLATSQANGGRGQQGNWLARFIIGALICNVPLLMHSLETTFGITGGTIAADGFNASSGMLAYAPEGGAAAALSRYTELIGYILRILVMFGVIAVWRGILYLRAFADGNDRGGMSPGITHIVGGVLLANAKFTTCMLMNTLLGAGLGFC